MELLQSCAKPSLYTCRRYMVVDIAKRIFEKKKIQMHRKT